MVDCFLSRRDFSHKAARINRYLTRRGMRLDLDQVLCSTSWTGFTSSIFSMTLSTFDTRPFRATAREGATQSFPSGCLRLWCGNQKPIQTREPLATLDLPTGSDAGYVESSHTRFLRISRFLIVEGADAGHLAAENRLDCPSMGMALVNVHPDYVVLGWSAGQHNGISVHSLQSAA